MSITVAMNEVTDNDQENQEFALQSRKVPWDRRLRSTLTIKHIYPRVPRPLTKSIGVMGQSSKVDPIHDVVLSSHKFFSTTSFVPRRNKAVPTSVTKNLVAIIALKRRRLQRARKCYYTSTLTPTGQVMTDDSESKPTTLQSSVVAASECSTSRQATVDNLKSTITSITSTNTEANAENQHEDFSSLAFVLPWLIPGVKLLKDENNNETCGNQSSPTITSTYLPSPSQTPLTITTMESLLLSLTTPNLHEQCPNATELDMPGQNLSSADVVSNTGKMTLPRALPLENSPRQKVPKQNQPPLASGVEMPDETKAANTNLQMLSLKNESPPNGEAATVLLAEAETTSEPQTSHLEGVEEYPDDTASEVIPYGKLSLSFQPMLLSKSPRRSSTNDNQVPQNSALDLQLKSPCSVDAPVFTDSSPLTGSKIANGNKRVSFKEDSQETVSSEHDDSKKPSSAKGSSNSRTSTSSSSSSSNNNMPSPLLKFASTQRPLKEQIDGLSKRSQNCLALLRQYWDADHRPMPGTMYLRFARFCGFDVREGRRVLSHFDERYLKLSIAQLEPQLLTKTLFPVPGLKSFNGHDMFYMRPSRFVPNTMQTQSVIDNLAYVLLTMVEKEESSTKGIGFLACMDDWTMENFSVEYCWQFMKMLQGGVPARVCLFLIVNPPSWFGVIWKIMKRMLHPAFQRKVKMIPERKLYRFLTSGYQTYLPNDMKIGTADTSKLVQDFVSYRKQVEGKRVKPKDR